MRRLVTVLAVPLLLLTATAPAQVQTPAAARPNIVLIMSDDMGYGDLSSYGAKDIKTPNIDSLGRDGVRLTDFYSNGVLCSPTRAGLISGRYQQRYVIENALGGEGTRGLKVTDASLPRVLKNNGYVTALMGKWHLGGTPDVSAMAHGFDHFFGFLAGYIDHYQHNRGPNQPDLWENDKPITQDGYMTDLITERTIGFIERTAAAGRPFFVDVAYNAPHWPYQPPDMPSVAPGNARHVMPNDAGTSTRADYAAMVERVDRGVGQILRALEQRGLARNTIVIFTNDNGGEWLANNRPLFNRKLTTWEGGIRVPALIRWPGRIPRGRVSRQVGITMDLTASMLSAAGVTPPPSYRPEGIDLIPLLEGRRTIERTLFWRTQAPGRLQRAARRGRWKYLRDGGTRTGGGYELLFDLERDVGERRDLAVANPSMVTEFRKLVTAWEAEVDSSRAALASSP